MKHASLKMLAGAAFALMLASTPALASDNSSGDQKAAPQYPNATRKEPKLDLTDKKEQEALSKGLDAVQANNKDQATQLLQPLIDNSKSKYVQALALQGLARVHATNNDLPGGIDLLKRSLDNGVMPNDTYFTLELELAQFYLLNQQYQQSIDTVEKWRNEGKNDKPESHALEGEAYYRMQKYPEAIAAIKQAQSMAGAKADPRWNQLLMLAYNDSGQKDKAAEIAKQQVASSPTDPTSFHNALSLDIQMNKYDDALKLMEEGKSKGLLSSENDYVTMAKLYMNKAQDQATQDPGPDSEKAVQTLQDGMAKGVVKASAENYVLMGDAHMIGGDASAAAAAYEKAVPLASDGEPAYKAGVALVTENENTKAKQLLQQAISKGVKHKGKAYMALAQANIGLKDKAAAATAVMEAEKDPETAAQAKKWLKDANIGG
jgi:predicted negative regulator of RcsB-dependent stress response